MRLHPRAFGFALSLLLVARLGVAGEPFSFEKTPGRLPKNVVPTGYKVYLEPVIDTATVVGHESIELRVTAVTRQIVLNAADLTLTKATLLVPGRAPQPLQMDLSDATQLLTLTAEEDVPIGNCRLQLAWTGKLTERTEGLFITRYTTAHGEKRALATHMEPSDARRMFPCWDEPVFRATFALTAVVPGEQMALSNMPIADEKALPDGRREVRFAPTPPMASYLVALAAGEFEAIEDEAEGVKLRIITTEGKKESARYALDATKQILRYYNEYFGVRYPLPKLDQFCFPAFPAGGMENWGAIFYHDTTMLVDPVTGSQANRERVFGVVAHELAHMWFGDLVTMAWWDDLWLNEGFASWMATKASDHFHPDWQMWLRASGSKEYAMALDARRSTHPIQKAVATEAQAMDSFDEITYQKGQSFLRMLEAYLGEEPFRDGIRAYLAAHAYGSATTADLWKSLESNLDKPVREVAADWTEQPGFPLIHAKAVCRDGLLSVTMRQERFTINQKEAPPLFWQTPVTLAPLFAPADHQQTIRLGREPVTLSVGTCDDLVKANLQGAGYYRVAYDEETLNRLMRVASSLPDAERLNLLTDVWALVQTERMPGARIFDMVRRLSRSETSFALWRQMLSVLGFFDNLSIGLPGRPAYRQWATAIVRRNYERLGWESKPGEPELDKLLRVDLLDAMGQWDNPDLEEGARRRFEHFVKNPKSMPGDLRRVVLTIVGRHADLKTYEQLHTMARQEPAADLRGDLYGALAGNRDPFLAAKTLAIALTDELPPNEAAGLVGRVMHNGEHLELAWNFAKANREAFYAKIGQMRARSFLPNLARNFADEERAHELESLAGELPEGAGPSVEKAVDEIRFKAGLKQRLLPQLEAFMRK